MIPLFEMDSIYSTFWNLIMILVFSVHFLIVPFHISFGLQKQDYNIGLWYLFHEFPIYLGSLDIFNSLNTAYYSKGVYVKDRKKIVRFYFKWSFWLDLCVVLPLLMIALDSSGELTLLHLNFFIVAIKIQIITTKLEDFFQFKDKPQGIINLLKLIFKVLAIANLCGCGWNYIAEWEINKLGYSNTWMNYLKIQNEGWSTRYVSSLYFSIVTMVTVGYGDITPQNPLEKTFAIFMIVLSCGFFAYALNSVGIILKEMYREDNEFK